MMTPTAIGSAREPTLLVTARSSREGVPDRDGAADGAAVDGVDFDELLARIRAALRSADQQTSNVALTDVDLAEAETAEDARSTEAERRIHPRIVGQGMVEYAVVVVLIAIVVIVLLGTVGHQAQDVFSNLSRGLST